MYYFYETCCFILASQTCLEVSFSSAPHSASNIYGRTTVLTVAAMFLPGLRPWVAMVAQTPTLVSKRLIGAGTGRHALQKKVAGWEAAHLHLKWQTDTETWQPEQGCLEMV